MNNEQVTLETAEFNKKTKSKTKTPTTPTNRMFSRLTGHELGFLPVRSTKYMGYILSSYYRSQSYQSQHNCWMSCPSNKMFSEDISESTLPL